MICFFSLLRFLGLNVATLPTSKLKRPIEFHQSYFTCQVKQDWYQQATIIRCLTSYSATWCFFCIPSGLRSIAPLHDRYHWWDFSPHPCPEKEVWYRSYRCWRHLWPHWYLKLFLFLLPLWITHARASSWTWPYLT